MAAFLYSATIEKLKNTPPGREATMYGPLRDLFVNILGYPPTDIDIDTAGEAGRPDLTIRAPSGFLDGRGNEAKIEWIVVEAKDERGCFVDPVLREKIFAEKSKYVGLHTAYFVMAEPEAWVIRPVAGMATGAEADIVIPLAHLSEAELRDRIVSLHCERAGVSLELKRFREGDTAIIGVEKLSIPGKTLEDLTPAQKTRIRLARKRFFDQVRDATQHLQEAVAGALARLGPNIATYRSDAEGFWAQFSGREEDGFDAPVLKLRGRPQGPDDSRMHDRESARLHRKFAQSPAIARLAIQGLPGFQKRTGADDSKLHALFAIETANLILARILLLRFFEDHGFFGSTRYVCNGGVAAFQEMKRYFKASYAALLENAYQEGSKLYASAFDLTELDWIFGARDETLSSAIEWTMFRFARFDFTTIKGDILTGIYDRFMDRDQRKRMGEFFTPPSIARYIVKRLDIQRNSRVLDPACGSGTFLIESYRAMVGEDVDRGAAEYPEVLAALERIAGNDLNTFSSVLAQIQLLWQILSFKEDMEQSGFPDILITAKVNSLVTADRWRAIERFGELDVSEYDVVVGNPPYVRAERSDQDLDAVSRQEFERGRSGFHGVSSKMNVYGLFLYRALDRWCKPADAEGNGAGRVGFVLPISLFDSNDMAALRQLFMIGGRWAIREIVDLEMIYRDVFDADVLPAIFIAENRPALAGDVVSIRFADKSCVIRHGGNAVSEFDIESLPESLVPYSAIFSPDWRILTRLTEARLAIVRTLWRNPTLSKAAKPYWVRKDGSRIVEWKEQVPDDELRWELRSFCGGGLAFRGGKHQHAQGIDVYKGENIIATELQGEPVMERVDMARVDDPGPWKYADILPRVGYAIARVAHCPNAVPFNPKEVAFTNTATLFFPRDDLIKVPFDLILLSNIYVWFYAIAARMGILRTLRSDIYPTNFSVLPWNESFAAAADKLENMRESVIQACRNRIDAEQSLRTALSGLNLPMLKQRVQANAEAKLSWSDGFAEKDYEVEIGVPSVLDQEDGYLVNLAGGLLDWVYCNQQDISRGLATALRQRKGQALNKSTLFNLPIPLTDAELEQWNAVVVHYQEDVLEQEMQDALNALDQLVGRCLGLTSDDITEIQRDLREDPFLKGIRPRYPGTVTRKQGFRANLGSGDRYAG